MHVLVAGGAGFVGRSCCRELLDRGHAVTATTRSRPAAGLPGAVQVATFDVTEDDPTALVAGHDALVNLIALPSHKDQPQAHDAVSRAGTEKLVRASEATDVGRFVQLSALDAGRDVDTAYFRAKDRAETLVRESDVPGVIVRPSVVFGEGAGIERYLRRITPPHVVPLPGADCRMQPLWVEDLAPMLADCVEAGEHAGETYELGGPEVLPLAEVVRLLRDDPLVVPVPDVIARLAFRIAGVLPGVPLGPDQFRHVQLDNTVDENDVTAFGVDTEDLTTMAEYVDGRASAATTTEATP